jgi:hypothetical protein
MAGDLNSLGRRIGKRGSFLTSRMQNRDAWVRNPSPSGYQRRDDFKSGQDIPIIVNGAEQSRIAVADIFS